MTPRELFTEIGNAFSELGEIVSKIWNTILDTSFAELVAWIGMFAIGYSVIVLVIRFFTWISDLLDERPEKKGKPLEKQTMFKLGKKLKKSISINKNDKTN